MKYQANPVIVDAFRIARVHKPAQDGSMLLGTECGRDLTAEREMMARMTPQVGDYWVIQSDGYVYLNPKDVFERKYSPVEPNALELGAGVRRLGLAGS